MIIRNFILTAICLLLFCAVKAQCTINFGSNAAILNFTTYSGDIVHAVAGETHYIDSFDVWKDDSTKVLDCSVNGGLADFSVEMNIIPTFDIYGGGIIDTLAGVRHDIVQSTSGLRGSLPFNNSGATESSTGDVRSYSIKVRFARHVNLIASNFSVNISSVNTDASVFESCVIEFLDSNGNVFAPATYRGYYDSLAPSRVDTLCPTGYLDSASFVRNDTPWVWNGAGTYASQSLNSVDIANICDPINGYKGPDDDKQVSPVTHAGLNSQDRIGGFIFTVYAEDVAGSASDSGGSASKTSTNTVITSTLNGFTIPGSLPVNWLNFDVQIDGNINWLQWSTATEINNSHFEIERYQPEKGFISIGRIEGAGNSTDIRLYEFTDYEGCDQTTCYYRIKQVDFDGRFSYSEVRSTRNSQEHNLFVSPNPILESGKLCFGEDVNKVIILNALGVEVMRSGKFQKGECLAINRSDLEKGYFVIWVFYEYSGMEKVPLLVGN